MSDEPPEISRVLPVRPTLRSAHRIGKKCVVTELGDGWICIHGTDGTGKPKDDDPCPEVAPMGSIGVDPSQARIYYRYKNDSRDQRILAVSADGYPFRISSQGFRPGHSKTFVSNREPFPQVLLLYALKTDREMDRLRALLSFSFSFWSNQLSPSIRGYDIPYPTLGDIFKEIQDIAEDLHSYILFVGRLMAEATRKPDGLNNWVLWENVASTAAQEALDFAARTRGESTANFEALFFQAVKETSIELGGLPSQKHVRDRWEKLGGRGDWKGILPRLGFSWLPGIAEWRKHWLRMRPEIEATLTSQVENSLA